MHVARREDPLLNLSFSLFSNPGVYALLLGSGVSGSAGIPTGWEIVLDLIRKLAAAEGATADDPTSWYRAKFREAPDYTKVVARLAKTSAERRGLLRPYFEPTEEEREEGLKVPTPAHRAIAGLVKAGLIRMILTTNFDRLMETALGDEGVAADVVSSPDAFKGAVPYVHSPCMLVKLHGDYLDIRIRNTTRELAKYPEPVNSFLDRVLDEFGLIVCGWSADWDRALADAILRCPTRRFTTFWLTRHELDGRSRELASNRRASVVTISNADDAFVRIDEQVGALQQLGLGHPKSTEVLVATVKRYLSEPRFRISLEELFAREVEDTCDHLTSAEFSMNPQGFDAETLSTRLTAYERICHGLTAMSAALAYYGEGINSSLLSSALIRLTQFSEWNGLNALLALRSYPGLLVSYAAGISALARRRWTALHELLYVPEFRDGSGRMKPALETLNIVSVLATLNDWIPRPRKGEYTAGSNHVFDVLRPIVREYLPDDQLYDDAFSTYEFLLATVYLDVVGAADNDYSSSPVGRFGWQHRYDLELAPWVRFQQGLNQGEDWELLKAGFFGGSPERARTLFDIQNAFTANVRARWH